MGENYYVILYVDAVADINTLTVTQKTEIVTKYPPPPEVLASDQWKNATAAQKWAWWVDNVMPPQLKQRIINHGVLPILRDAADKLEIIEQYWKLAQEGTKYVFLLHIDVSAGQGAQIKNWLDRQPGLRYWYGESMKNVCINLYQAGRAGDAIATAVAKRIIKYPVTVQIDGVDVIKFVTILEAESPPYSVTIQPEVLLQYKDEILPMKIFDGSR